ncbi:MAG: hypothetical protein WAV95_17840 [Azonexus sp.]
MALIKLAYLAEFAVAFNMAFGEFKHEKTAEAVGNSFVKIDYDFETSLKDIIKKSKSIDSGKTDDKYTRSTTNWLGKSINRFDKIRKYREGGDVDGKKYRPLKYFFNRALVFSTNPTDIETRGNGKFGTFISVCKGIPRGFLASWAYTKTPNWAFPPCSSSLISWSLVALACPLVAGLLGFVEIQNIFNSDNTYKTPSWFFVLLGSTLAFFSPRPLSYILATILGKPSPTPRGRFYPLVLVLLITLSLIGITLLEETLQSSASEHAIHTIWLFSFGFLVAAMASPMLLFGGYISLLNSLDQWSRWTEAQAKYLVDINIGKLETLENIPKATDDSAVE